MKIAAPKNTLVFRKTLLPSVSEWARWKIVETHHHSSSSSGKIDEDEIREKSLVWLCWGWFYHKTTPPPLLFGSFRVFLPLSLARAFKQGMLCKNVVGVFIFISQRTHTYTVGVEKIPTRENRLPRSNCVCVGVMYFRVCVWLKSKKCKHSALQK